MLHRMLTTKSIAAINAADMHMLHVVSDASNEPLYEFPSDLKLVCAGLFGYLFCDLGTR
jgi:hypothetical protein